MRWTNQIHGGRSSGKPDATEQIPAWSGITELARVALKAASAVMVCSPMLLAAVPKTPLRVFCIASFEYFARLRGGTLGRKRRLAMAYACDFGSLRNHYYDRQRLDATEYRLLRCKLRRTAPETATRRYIQQLRQAERSRPIVAAYAPRLADSVVEYRTRVLDLTLRWLQSISGLSVEPAKFQALLSVGGLTQLADDLLDWKDDQAARRPSYVTAFLVDRPRNAVALPLRIEADALLQRTVYAARQDVGAVPFAVAGMLIWAFVIAVLKMRFPQ